MQRKPLREELAERRRARGGRPAQQKTKDPQRVAPSEYSKLHGERREHPELSGLRWLKFFQEALQMHGLINAGRVSVKNWERDGCISLYMQRIVWGERAAPVVTAGFAHKTAETERVPLGGGAWDHWRIPIGLINAHDTAALSKLILSPKDQELVLASNPMIRAIHGR